MTWPHTSPRGPTTCFTGPSFFFFFSSRRRHTRSLCDWSSDVCSSDLHCCIEGTVKIHVIVSREGIVQQLIPLDGPALLVPATVRAVQQWRYTQTLLAGQAVETEDDIAVDRKSVV